MSMDFMASDFVISSHIKFYRNVSGVPFASKMSADDGDDILRHAGKALDRLWGEGEYTYEILTDRKKADELYYKDITYRFKCGDSGIRRTLFSSPDGTVTVLANEAEHLIISADYDGYQLANVYKGACECTNALSDRIPFAVRDDIGFLTANPYCSGAGLSAAVLVHIPALALSPEFGSLAKELKAFGVGIKSYYIDKKRAFGCMFYVYNLYSAGLTEGDILKSVIDGVEHIVKKEDELRCSIVGAKRKLIQDAVWRSFGVLATARRLNALEFTVNISNIRFGVELRELDIPVEEVDRLLKMGTTEYIKKYTLMRALDTERDNDAIRARIMREEFAPMLKTMI